MGWLLSAYVEIKNRINQFLSLINPILFFSFFLYDCSCGNFNTERRIHE